MRGNDLTNRQAPYIVFDIDSFLFAEEEAKSPILKRIGDFFKDDVTRFSEKKFNPVAVALLERVWNKHNVCIGLVSFTATSAEYQSAMEVLLNEYNVPYTRFLPLANWEELREFPALYVFTRNEELISFISDNRAVHVDRIWEVL